MTVFLPTEDRYSHSRQRLESQLSTLFGGRVAEGLIFGEEAVTTGASNDIKRATEIAKGMVKKWGLSALGPIAFDDDEGEVFLGNSMAKQSSSVSENTFEKIDREIENILTRNYQRAEEILKENIDKLHLMAKALIKTETIDVEQIKVIMSGKDLEAQDAKPRKQQTLPGEQDSEQESE